MLPFPNIQICHVSLLMDCQSEWQCIACETFQACFQRLLYGSICLILPGDPKKYSRVTKHQAMVFCSITSVYLDSESILRSEGLFINLDFDT